MTMNNSTSNFSEGSSCKHLEPSAQEGSDVAKWISLIEAIGIITLNSALIYLLSKRKKPSRMAFFVHHLAIADLAVGLLYVLPECIFDRFLNSWEWFSCMVLYGYCANLTIYASTFLIVVLTIDRLFVITKPLSASTTGKKYRYGLISGAWLLAVLLALPYALHVKFLCTNLGNLCGHGFKNKKAIIIAELFINLIIPVIIITFCYTWIVFVIVRRERAGFGCPAQKVRFSNGSTTLTGHFQKMESSNSSVINSAKKKTIKVLFVVVIVYILSWAPINFAQVLNVFNILKHGDEFIYLHMLAPINSLTNPLVFIWFNRQLFKTEKTTHKGYTTTCHTEQEVHQTDITVKRSLI